jgi:hypothetical protein
VTVVPPYWFAQRQGKAEEAGPEAYRLTAPNLKEALVGVRSEAGDRWSAYLRLTSDGTDLAATPAEYTRLEDAWDAAFELYRNHLVV